jgi:hypothetical protein
MILPSRLGRVLVVGAAAVAGVTCAASDARATLGADLASVDADVQTYGATRVVQKLSVGERHELTLPSGIVVHEYVSPSGAVYAVTWRGSRVPDLRAMLGAYFPQLAVASKRGGHHDATFTGTDFVVRSTGHGHTFHGRAWVPSLVPAGVTIDASID